MTPKELEARCRAVGVWPEGLTIHAPSGDWYRYTGFVNADEAEAFILAELMAKMPNKLGVNKYRGRYIACSYHNRHNLGEYDTPIEAAIACHEHYKWTTQ